MLSINEIVALWGSLCFKQKEFYSLLIGHFFEKLNCVRQGIENVFIHWGLWGLLINCCRLVVLIDFRCRYPKLAR